MKRRKTRETWRAQRNGTRKGKFDRDPVTLYESTLIHRFVLPLTSRLRLFSCRRKYRRQSLDLPDGNKLAKRSYVCDQRYVYWLCSLCMFFFSFFPFFSFSFLIETERLLRSIEKQLKRNDGALVHEKWITSVRCMIQWSNIWNSDKVQKYSISNKAHLFLILSLILSRQ